MQARPRDMLSSSPALARPGKEALPRADEALPPFDIARCFGHYRQQSARYALTYCLVCPKLKPCVRTVWGVDEPRRGRRGDWWQQPQKGPRADRRTYPHSLPPDDYAAT